jgi:hypothetical protein
MPRPIQIHARKYPCQGEKKPLPPRFVLQKDQNDRPASRFDLFQESAGWEKSLVGGFLCVMMEKGKKLFFEN